MEEPERLGLQVCGFLQMAENRIGGGKWEANTRFRFLKNLDMT